MKISGEIQNPEMGILEWFHLNDKDHVRKVIRQMNTTGFKELRTGISWADYHTEEGQEWLEWLIPTLSEHVNILPCLLYTPPSIGIKPKTSSPPKHPDYFADFVHKIMKQYGDYFSWVELWNEPNNTSEYDFRLDPDWSVFKKLITWAAKEVKNHRKQVLLGGMSPIDPGWLKHMYRIGLMEQIDAVGIHGFPGTFDTSWPGWGEVVQQIRDVIDANDGKQDIWITEVGYSTWQQDEKKQLEEFIQARQAPVNRVYWYSMNDLASNRPTIDGFHLDDREYSFGMVDEKGRSKLLYRLIEKNGIDDLEQYPWMTEPYITIPESRKRVLITGGAGFIGSNLAHQLLSEDVPVTILDSLHRPGVEDNLDWLQRNHPDNLDIVIADIRNRYRVQEAVDKASFVYHLAAQVAVTTSCTDPVLDFQTNIAGSIHILEAIRHSPHRPPVLFTSTNKVYGELADMELTPNKTRYLAEPEAVDEQQKLNFLSPYGCSKGAADAYFLDYARTWGLQAVVFRMSCIYGPHQLGTEDQGWVAHFLIQALKDRPITIFGDGKQVRDLLYVDDLIEAFQLVRSQIDSVSGEVFNMGGGFENSVSLNELITYIEKLTGDNVVHNYSDWREGDQKYYISDTRKFSSMTGWKPRWSTEEGIRQLHAWLIDSELVPVSDKSLTA